MGRERIVEKSWDETVAAHASEEELAFDARDRATPSLRRLENALDHAVENPMMVQGALCSIKEAAALLGVTPSTLRYWEDEGLIGSSRSKTGNYRMYSIHDLFAASYVSFYRNMGVPVKTISANQDDSLDDIVAMLDATQEAVDAQLCRLERVRDRLRTQALLARHASDLLGQGVRLADPSAKLFAAYDPASVAQRRALLRDSQRYAVLISAERPDTMVEGCIDFPGDAPAVGEGEVPDILWDRKEEARAGVTYYEGVAFSEKGGFVFVDAGRLSAEVRACGAEPLYALAHFLVSANFDGRKDCYRVWVACRAAD